MDGRVIGIVGIMGSFEGNYVLMIVVVVIGSFVVLFPFLCSPISDNSKCFWDQYWVGEYCWRG